MEGQPSNPRRHGNQNGPGDSMGASVHRAIDWNDSARVFGPVIVLDRDGFRDEAVCVPGLLQQTSNSLSTEGTNTGRRSGIQERGVETLSLAKALSRSISDANCCMSTNSPGTGAGFPCYRY